MTLVEIIEAICDRAGLPVEFIDTSLLPDVAVDGLVVTNQYAAIEGLRSLGQVYLFDVVPVDGKVWFVPRGGNVAATVAYDEVVDLDDTPLELRRDDQLQIPRLLHLNYYDSNNGGLNSGKQTSERIGVRRATGEKSIQTPIVMTADLAIRTADIQHKVIVEETGSGLKLSLPESYLFLVPTNPIFFQRPGVTDRLRITQATVFDGYQEYECVRDRQSAYTSDLEGMPLSLPSAPPENIVGPTTVEVLDVRPLQDADDAIGLGFYIAVSGATSVWNGALVEISRDAGATYPESYSISTLATLGNLLTALGDHSAAYPDDVNKCRVNLTTYGADLLDATLEDMLNRVNLAMIGDELVNFGDVTDLGDGDWELGHWLRARKGTDAQSHSAGARFVRVDRSVLLLVPAKVEDLGKAFKIRATSFGLTTDDATFADFNFEGNLQLEYPVGYLQAHVSTTGLLTVSWQGAGRLGSGASASHGSKFTGYKVTIWDGIGTPVVTQTTDEELVVEANTLNLNSPLTITVVATNSLTGDGPERSIVLDVPGLAPIPYPTANYDITFTGAPGATETFYVQAYLVPLSGPITQQLITSIDASGKTVANDYANDLAAQADAAFGAAVTVTQPSSGVVRLSVTNGNTMIVNVSPVHPYGTSSTVRAPMPAQSAVQQVVGLELYSVVGGVVDPAPSVSAQYRQGGTALANFVIDGYTFEAREEVNYGLARTAIWTVADNVSDQKIVSLEGAVVALQASQFAPYFSNVAQMSLSGGRTGVGVWLKEGYKILPNKLDASGTGSHPSGFKVAFEEVIAGVPGYPTGAKQMSIAYFTPQRNAGPTPALMSAGQDVTITLNGTPFSHTLTSDEAAAFNATGSLSPAVAAYMNDVYDDLESQIEGTGNFDVLHEAYANTQYKNWRIERAVANTAFTIELSVSGFDVGVSVNRFDT